MRALDLDFAKRTGLPRRLGYILLIGSLAAVGYVGLAYFQLSANLDTWETKWRSLQKAQRKDTDPGPRQKAEWEQMQSELKAANRVIVRLSMPWDALFQEVERSVDEQITLLGVEPDPEKRELRITAEAKSLTAMLDYMKRLRAAALFRDAYILSHQVQQQDPQKPVRFVVTAQWGEPVLQAEDNHLR
jgi:Tfp pilus assembly protein PilN